MSTRTVNLDTYSLSLLTAKEDILNPRSSTNWTLFAYDGISNKLKLVDSGAGGVSELAAKFNPSKPMYGLCRIGSSESGGPRTAMISWMGQNVDDYRRTECANHLPEVKNFFKEAHAFLTAEKPEEVTEERIRAELSKAKTNASTQWLRRSSRSLDNEDIVGTNYRKTNAAMEMRRINRDSFWARAEREEEERKEEERKRAAEDRRRLERERALKERKDADERDRKMNEKLKKIEEQRRKQAEQEEEERRKEKLKWEQQQREHEEEMRARLKRRESIEKAAEAAALVSQRTMNPREFFRQLSSSSSQSPTSPPRTGKPFRRYQRSLTDTAFIFSKAEESSASSPRSSPLVSPFSRAPSFPFNRATSPPTSPVFHPSISPQRTALSPPLSPLRPTPPTSALPGVPQVKARAQSPTEPSAPPASPTLVASDVPASEGLPVSSPNISHSEEHSIFCFEPSVTPPAPVASPTEKQPITDLFAAAELVSDIGYKVQAVLVEEDEEEEEEDAGTHHSEPITEPQPKSMEAVELKQVEMDTTQPKESTFVQEEVKHVQKEDIRESLERDETLEEENFEEDVQEDKEIQEIFVKTEDIEESEDEEEKKEQEQVEPTSDLVTLVKPLELQQEDVIGAEKEFNQSEEDQGNDEPAHILQHVDNFEVTEDARSEESQEIKCVTTDLPINTIPNGGTPEHNGTDHTLCPSDPELDSPESAVYCDFQETEEDDEEDFSGQNYTKIMENGQEVLPEQQLVCVRALYDYQAEDDSEISFEPGDIIKDVEAVDKAWWRGWSKDGRQGLFPANYVETILPQ